MDELFENQILNDIYETRTDGFESIYIKQYGEPEETIKSRELDEKLIALIETKIKDKKDLDEIWNKLDDFKDAVIDEMCFWNEQYYKFGFLDRVHLKKEIEDNNKKDFAVNAVNIKDTFFYNSINVIEEILGKNVWNKKEYKETMKKVNEIKEKYSNVTNFLENNEINVLTKKELEILNEYLRLMEDIRNIELVETFKLGIKEGILL